MVIFYRVRRTQVELTQKCSMNFHLRKESQKISVYVLLTHIFVRLSVSGKHLQPNKYLL